MTTDQEDYKAEQAEDEASTAVLDAAKDLRDACDEGDYNVMIAELLMKVGSRANSINNLEPELRDEALRLLNEAIVRQMKAGKKKDLTIEDVVADWAWCVEPERFVRIEDGRMWSRSQFDSRFNHLAGDKPSVSGVIFKRASLIRKTEQLLFRPGSPMIIGKDFNIWRPSPITPKAGDTTLWDAHLKYLFPDPADWKRAFYWMCWVYRNQHLKPNCALLIVGTQTGTGKSFVARVMERLIGETNTQRPKNSSIKGEFNGWHLRCKLCLIEELMQIGRRDVLNELRDTITESRIEINIKNIPAFVIDNYMAMMGITNHLDALPLDQTDRRWDIVAATNDRRDPDYYDPLFYGILDGPGRVVALQAIAHQLMTYDIGSYDALQSVTRMSAAKAEMVDLALPPLTKWFRAEVAAKNYPFNLKLINVRQDIIDGTGAGSAIGVIPKDVQQRTKGDLETEITRLLKTELAAGNFGGDVSRLGKGHKAKWGVLWGINGGQQEFAEATRGERTAAYLAGRVAAEKRGSGDDAENDQADAEIAEAEAAAEAEAFEAELNAHSANDNAAAPSPPPYARRRS